MIESKLNRWTVFHSLISVTTTGSLSIFMSSYSNFSFIMSIIPSLFVYFYGVLTENFNFFGSTLKVGTGLFFVTTNYLFFSLYLMFSNFRYFSITYLSSSVLYLKMGFFDSSSESSSESSFLFFFFFCFFFSSLELTSSESG